MDNGQDSIKKLNRFFLQNTKTNNFYPHQL